MKIRKCLPFAALALCLAVLAIESCDKLVTERIVDSVFVYENIRAEFVVATGYTDSGCVGLTTRFADRSAGPVDQWIWNYGDNTADTVVKDTFTNYEVLDSALSPEHTYDFSGTYDVSLTVSRDTTGGTAVDTRSKKRLVIVGTNIDSFVATPDSGCPGMEVTFTPQGTGGIETYLWNFGDPSSGSSNNSSDSMPTHVYDSVGVYSVTVTVNNPECGSKVLVYDSLITVSSCPTAGFTVDTNGFCVPQTVTFTDASVPYDGTVLTEWKWHFGNGTTTTNTTGAQVSTEYVTARDYVCTLYVRSDSGHWGIYTDTITGYADPAADFTALSPTIACKVPGRQFQVKFQAQLGGSVDTLIWRFGDGDSVRDSVLSDTTVIHAYTDTGFYTVSLTAKGECGDSTVAKDSFVIVSLPLPVETADFQVLPSVGDSSTNFWFKDNTAGTQIYERIWDFGDGTADTVNDILTTTHKYAQTDTVPDTLTVSLRVTNGCDTAEASHDVILNPIIEE